MQNIRASEALWRTLLYMVDVVVSEPFRDTSETLSVLEKLARKSETTRRVDVEVDWLYAGRIPVFKPPLKGLLCGVGLVVLQEGDAMPDPEDWDFVKPQLLHARLTQTVQVGENDEQTFSIPALIFTIFVAGAALELTTKDDLGRIFAGKDRFLKIG